jgi:hypothetical protein
VHGERISPHKFRTPVRLGPRRHRHDDDLRPPRPPARRRRPPLGASVQGVERVVDAGPGGGAHSFVSLSPPPVSPAPGTRRDHRPPRRADSEAAANNLNLIAFEERDRSDGTAKALLNPLSSLETGAWLLARLDLPDELARDGDLVRRRVGRASEATSAPAALTRTAARTASRDGGVSARPTPGPLLLPAPVRRARPPASRRDDPWLGTNPGRCGALALHRLRIEKRGEVAHSSYFSDAGGGTRTPDTRIMIPLL